MAPAGGQVVIIQKVLEINYDAIPDWAAQKASVEQYIMRNFEQVLPGLSQKIVVKQTALALTSPPGIWLSVSESLTNPSRTSPNSRKHNRQL